MSERRGVEWPTLGLIGLCYLVLGIALFVPVSIWIAVPMAGVAIALHSSLTHEVIHGHPTRSRLLNAALVWPAVSLIVPFARFRDTHLAHHYDANLTDPYDDPESNYLDPIRWAGMSAPLKALLRFNNTLLGRILLGPVIGTIFWLRGDWRAVLRGDRLVIRGWLEHLPAMAAVVLVVLWAPLPLWAYLIAVWLGLGLIRIRTYLEHQAVEDVGGRTVVVEDRGPLSWLFLNNNLHVVHHLHPTVPWYDLPALYRARRNAYLGRNGGYVYRSYREVIAAHLFRAKDPLPHPLMPPR